MYDGLFYTVRKPATSADSVKKHGFGTVSMLLTSAKVVYGWLFYTVRGCRTSADKAEMHGFGTVSMHEKARP